MDLRATSALFLLVSLFASAICEEQLDGKNIASKSERTARQMRADWPMPIWPYGGAGGGLSRQIFDMIDIVTDVAMLTLVGIPILGLVALGATVLGPVFSTASAAGRRKRDANGGLMDRAGRAFLYARNLFDIYANLEEAFKKFGINESECQLKFICEVHKTRSKSSQHFGNFGNLLIDSIR